MKFQEPSVMSTGYLNSSKVSDRLNSIHDKFMIRRENIFDSLIKKYEQPAKSFSIDMDSFSAVEDSGYPCDETLNELYSNSISMEISREEEKELAEIFKIVRKQMRKSNSSSNNEDETYCFIRKSRKNKDSGTIKTISIKRRRTVEKVPVDEDLPSCNSSSSKKKKTNHISKDYQPYATSQQLYDTSLSSQSKQQSSKSNKGVSHKRSKSETLQINRIQTKNKKSNNLEQSSGQASSKSRKRTKSAHVVLNTETTKLSKQNYRSLKQSLLKTKDSHGENIDVTTKATSEQKLIYEENVEMHSRRKAHRRSKSCPSEESQQSATSYRAQPCRRCKKMYSTPTFEKEFSRLCDLYCIKNCSVVCEPLQDSTIALYESGVSEDLNAKPTPTSTKFRRKRNIECSRTQTFEKRESNNSCTTKISMSCNYSETNSLEINDRTSPVLPYEKRSTFLHSLDDTFVTIPSSKKSNLCSNLSLTFSPVSKYVCKVFKLGLLVS